MSHSRSRYTGYSFLDPDTNPESYREYDENGNINILNNTESNMFIELLFSDLVNIDNDTKALLFVKNTLKYITIAELAKNFFRYSNKLSKKYKANFRKATGGQYDNLGPIINVENGDSHIYRFLLLLDTIHDFTIDDDYLLKHYKYIPKGLNADMIKNESQCIKWLSQQDVLIIDSIVINNPFRDMNLDGYNINTVLEKHPDITYDQLLQKKITSVSNKANNKSFCVDIFNHREISELDHRSMIRKKKYYRLECIQLYNLIGYMNTTYNTKIVNFQLDGVNSPFYKLLFSLSLINNAVQDIFRIDPDAKLFLDRNQIANNTIRWQVLFSDANLFDQPISSLIKNKEVRATGNIYDSRLVPYQIFIDGVHHEIPPNAKQPGQFKPYTNLTIIEPNKDKKFKIDDTTSLNNFSRDIIKTIVATKVDNYIVSPSETKIIKILPIFSIETLYAIKRAGDWSQVEHCKKYGKVFITGDRYAALYAYFRKVSTILIRTELKLYETKNDSIASTNPELGIYSFILINP